MEVSVTYFCNKVFDFYLCLTLHEMQHICWCLTGGVSETTVSVFYVTETS